MAAKHSHLFASSLPSFNPLLTKHFIRNLKLTTDTKALQISSFFTDKILHSSNAVYHRCLFRLMKNDISLQKEISLTCIFLLWNFFRFSWGSFPAFPCLRIDGLQYTKYQLGKIYLKLPGCHFKGQFHQAANGHAHGAGWVHLIPHSITVNLPWKVQFGECGKWVGSGRREERR